MLCLRNQYQNLPHHSLESLSCHRALQPIYKKIKCKFFLHFNVSFYLYFIHPVFKLTRITMFSDFDHALCVYLTIILAGYTFTHTHTYTNSRPISREVGRDYGSSFWTFLTNLSRLLQTELFRLLLKWHFLMTSAI